MQTLIQHGGAFLLSAATAEPIFIPELFDEDAKMMAETMQTFLETEVLPHIEAIDAHTDESLVPALLDKAGALGLLAISLPEEYGGFGMNIRASMLFGEVSARGYSFATSIGAHTSIGTLPILYYGNAAQKAKYLPLLATGARKSCYCLTEPDAGSDANAGKSRAVLNAAGSHYTLNGQKMWISNGGFADTFIVFAKIEENGVADENLSAFIVEKEFGGITLGEEEKKLGIKGSSTVQVFFSDCPIPVENLLGSRGEGFKIALNILNSGRLKLALGSLTGSKFSTQMSVDYARQRKQFGKPIAEFGAIQQKIANMAARTFAAESACYRIGGYVDAHIDRVAPEIGKEAATLAALREFAIEASIVKVYASEVLAYCVDEALQVHGGMGYSADLPIERAYRDARITRIYEGTNEINRLLSVGELFKRGMGTKEIPLLAALKSAPKRAIAAWLMPSDDIETRIERLKTAFLLIAGIAASKLKTRLVEEQEIVLYLSDMLAEAFVAESTQLRIRTLANLPEHAARIAHYRDLQQLHLYEATDHVRKAGKDAIFSIAKGAERRVLLALLNALTRPLDCAPSALRTKISASL